jgi:hypothetical protein
MILSMPWIPPSKLGRDPINLSADSFSQSPLFSDSG